MRKGSVVEVRTIQLPIEVVVDAILELDRAQGGTLSKGEVRDATMETGENPGLSLVVSQGAGDQSSVVTKRLTLTAVAAAVIHYCFKSRIPLPRNSSKSMTIVPEGFQLTLETRSEVPSLHGSAMAAWQSGQVEPAVEGDAVTAPEESAQPEPADASAA